MDCYLSTCLSIYKSIFIYSLNLTCYILNKITYLAIIDYFPDSRENLSLENSHLTLTLTQEIIHFLCGPHYFPAVSITDLLPSLESFIETESDIHTYIHVYMCIKQ